MLCYESKILVQVTRYKALYFFCVCSTQVCTMLKCKSTNLTTCGQPVETALTRFELFSLSGTFGTEYVFPEVLLTKINLAPGKFEVGEF